MGFIEKVYLDRNQCNKFKVEYYGESSLNISCRKLRASMDYDSAHCALFDAHVDGIFHLTRAAADAPGWYHWRLF